MTSTILSSGAYIATEGSSVELQFNRTSDTTATISWKVPASPRRAYNGFLILLSDQAINPSNAPTDSVKYRATNDYSAPVDKIGNAVVVGAFYNDETTQRVDVTGLDPDDVYYASGHLITNVRQYYTFGVKSYPETMQTQSYTGDIPSADAPPTDAEAGAVYYDKTKGKVFSYDGNAWLPATTDVVLTGSELPSTGTIGSFFYNTVTKKLYSWSGAIWLHVNTVNAGLDTPNKVGVGTDGTYTARIRLIDVLKKQLGFPVMCVELNDDHFNIAIDNAIEELRRRVDNVYKRTYIKLQVQPGQQIYYLNDPVLGTNKIVDVIKVMRTSQWGLTSTAEGGLYAQSILRDFFQPGGQIDLVSVHLVHQMSETFSQLFSSDFDFSYDEYTRELKLYKRVFKQEYVLIEASAEKTEQEILVDRWTTQWVQGWALSECREMLGMIRSKFGSLPGAGGGISLNGSELLQQANEEKTELLRQISDYEVGNGTTFGNYSFLIG
jgi:hypothetical protein